MTQNTAKKVDFTAKNDEFTSSTAPSFKGRIKFGGALGGIIGTFAGIGAAVVTVGTGGLAAPLIAACVGCGAGAIGGDMIEETIRPSRDDD